MRFEHPVCHGSRMATYITLYYAPCLLTLLFTHWLIGVSNV